MANWNISSQEIGLQPIESTDTVQRHALGKLCKAVHATYGEGEFIYLKGVASTAVGEAVVYDSAYATTRTVAASRGPVGISMSANVANQYGWYQIEGIAVAKAATVASGAAVQATATNGTIDDTTTAGQYIDGAVTKSADGTPSAGFALVALSRPCMNGR